MGRAPGVDTFTKTAPMQCALEVKRSLGNFVVVVKAFNIFLIREDTAKQVHKNWNSSRMFTDEK